MTASTGELVQVRHEKLKNIQFSVNRITDGYCHTHSGLEMGLVLDGEIMIHWEEHSRQAGKGELFLFNAYQDHVIESQIGADVLLLQLAPGFGKEYFARIASVEFDIAALPQLDTQTTDQLRRCLLNGAQVFYGEAPAYGLECAGWLAHMVSVMLRRIPYDLSTDSEHMGKKKKHSRKQRISDFVEQHYWEKLTLTQLAKSEGITTAYMSRIFAELFGEPFQEYLSKFRLQKAIPLLRKNDMYLVDICMECGFSDTRYLNAVCQKLHGCSVAEYRLRLPEEDPTGPNAPKPDGLPYSSADALRILHNYLLN